MAEKDENMANKQPEEKKKYGVLAFETFFPGLDTKEEAEEHFKQKKGIAIIESKKPVSEKKVCPGGRVEVETGNIMVVEIITKEERCVQSDGCRFFIRGREFYCSYYKPNMGGE